MRETRLSGLEGGGADIRSPYPYHRFTFRWTRAGPDNKKTAIQGGFGWKNVNRDQAAFAGLAATFVLGASFFRFKYATRRFRFVVLLLCWPIN